MLDMLKIKTTVKSKLKVISMIQNELRKLLGVRIAKLKALA